MVGEVKDTMKLGEEEDVDVEEEEEDEDEDEEGPPPGFQCIAVRQQKETMEADQNEEEEEEEDDDGDDDDDDDDSDGPPPGWSPIPQPAQIIQTSDAEMFDKQDDDEDDNGPPPGWNIPPRTPQLAEAIPSGDMEGKQEETKAEAMNQSTFVSQPLVSIPPLRAPATLVPSEKGQMVCGTCRQLLSYPRGVKYVQCSCCQTANLVLEAHQVGQVKCEGCAVLLMYPYGAPSVKCSSCCFVTKIGEHNRRPPLSVQQERRQPPLNRVHYNVS